LRWSELLTSVDETKAVEILGQEVPALVVNSISFHHAYEDRCVVEVNDELYWTLTTKQKQDFAIAIAHFLSELHGCLAVSEAVAAGLRSPEDPL
jgi:hypothetical protein